jgi:hypothetical protein
MSILILENEYPIAKQLKHNFDTQGHEAIVAYNIFQARDAWLKERQEISYIIADLHMDPSGLTETERNETERGRYSGYIWLRNYVFSDPDFGNIRDFTIIMSAYTQGFGQAFPDLKDYILPDNVIAKGPGSFAKLEKRFDVLVTNRINLSI